MTRGKVLFRADGNKTIGLGHLHRCIALADIISSEFTVTFAVREPLPGVAEMIREINGDLVKLPGNTDYLIEAKSMLPSLNNFDIVVLDGYSFNTEYQQIFKLSNAKIICIDDIHSFHFVCDGVINHAGGLSRQHYSAEPRTQFFLGTKYCIVKKSFLTAARSKPHEGEREDMALICMGGADPNNYTLGILKKCLERSTQRRFTIVVGEAYQHGEELKKFMDAVKLNASVLVNLKPHQLLSLMKKCKIAICPASGVAYEYECVGGELYLEQTAENQHDINHYLINNSLAFRFSDYPVSDHEKVQTLLNNQKKEFDGSSEQRLLKIFRSFYLDLHSWLRKAAKEDLMLIFDWINDGETRKNAFNPAPINLEDHAKWFQNKLADKNCYLYVMECDKHAVGQVRFDVDRETTISYSIGPDFRGAGLGSIILKKGIEKFLADSAFEGTIVALVKMENDFSNNIFLKLGFDQEPDAIRKNAFRYNLKFKKDADRN